MKGKYCKDCVLKGRFPTGEWGCQLSKQIIDLEKDYCSKCKTTPYICDGCNAIIPFANLTYVVEIEKDEWITLCPQCTQIWLNQNNETKNT